MDSELFKKKDPDTYHTIKLVPKYQYCHFALAQILGPDLVSSLSGRRMAAVRPEILHGACFETGPHLILDGLHPSASTF